MSSHCCANIYLFLSGQLLYSLLLNGSRQPIEVIERMNIYVFTLLCDISLSIVH